MDKTKLGILLAGISLGAVGGVVGSSTAATAPSQYELINMKLVKNSLADGGTVWTTRACAYETGPDGGSLGEPCWQGVLPANLVSPLVTSMLDQK